MKRKDELEQLREMDLEGLQDQADALKESLFRLKFRKSLGVGEVVADIRREKKTLARVYSIIREREFKAKKSQADEKAQA